MNCVRCKMEETIEEEIVCKKCLKELIKKFKVQGNQDPLDNPKIKQLLNDYEKFS